MDHTPINGKCLMDRLMECHMECPMECPMECIKECLKKSPITWDTHHPISKTSCPILHNRFTCKQGNKRHGYINHANVNQDKRAQCNKTHQVHLATPHPGLMPLAATETIIHPKEIQTHLKEIPMLHSPTPRTKTHLLIQKI